MTASRRGAPAAYRGYRLQALYTLHRLLNASDATAIQAEGKEDLDILTAGLLSETIQVKSYSGLALSDLEPEDPKGFFHRVLQHMAESVPPQITLVNFGPLGPEMRNAWSADGSERRQIKKKLGQFNYTSSQISWLFAHVAVLEVDETNLRDAVDQNLREYLVGIDPKTAFDLLNFWLYLQAEMRERITREQIYARTHGIAKFLAEQHAHHKEWYTSIIPLDLRADETRAKDELAHEFSLGVSTRYEHIAADLDLVRQRWIDSISDEFTKNNVVVIHAASGQGKTALAYRYLREHFPSKYTFQIDLINDRAHTLSIERALSGFAQVVQNPLAIYIDVSPRDTDWPELVRRIALNRNLRILVTIREEDLRKALLSRSELSYSGIELVLSADEAREIFARLMLDRSAARFIDFDEAWTRFGSQGPLLEFVYLVTQTETLRERLKGQIERINQDVDRGLRPVAEVRMLRVIAIYNSLEARVDIRELARLFPDVEVARVVQKLEREYLLRISSDQGGIEGLHPVRSIIVADLLCDAAINTKHAIASSMLDLVYEEDVENVALHVFIESEDSRQNLLKSMRGRRWNTWAGAAGCLRAQAWTLIRDYIRNQEELIELAYAGFGKGFSIWLDFDLTDMSSPSLQDAFNHVLGQVPESRRTKINELRARQASPSGIFDSLRDWLAALLPPDQFPQTNNDWAGVAQLWFWSEYFHLNQHHGLLVANEHFAGAVKTLPLGVLAEVLHAVSYWNASQYDLLLEQHRTTFHERLADEYGVFLLAPEAEDVTIHYIIDPSIKDWHNETLERVWIVRNMFPRYSHYGAQAYGHSFGERLPLVYDPTQKNRIPRDMLPVAWKAYVNYTAIGLASYGVRLASWNEYAELILSIRHAAVEALKALKQQVLQISTATGPKLGLSTGLQESLLAFEALERKAGLLPKSAVDPWGFTSESRGNNRPGSGPENAGALTMPLFRSKSFSVKRHQEYLDAEKEYLGKLQTFLEQAINVVLVRQTMLGKKPQVQPQILDALRNAGIRIDLTRHSVHNLHDAYRALVPFQHQFASKFVRGIDAEALQSVENSERELLNALWPTWYFFAEAPHHHPKNLIADAHRQLQATRNEIIARFRRACKSASDSGVQASFMRGTNGWDGKRAVWIQLDVDYAPQLHTALELLMLEMKRHIKLYDYASLFSHAAEDFAEFVVVFPTIRGRGLRQKAWVLHLRATIMGDVDYSDPSLQWKFVQQAVSEQDWKIAGLETWDLPDVALALDLETSMASLWANVARIVPALDAPNEWELDGTDVLRRFFMSCLHDVDSSLQAVYTAIERMAERFAGADGEELADRLDWMSAAQDLQRIFPFVATLDGTNTIKQLELSDIPAYEQRLHEALGICQEIVLSWIADAVPSPAA